MFAIACIEMKMRGSVNMSPIRVINGAVRLSGSQPLRKLKNAINMVKRIIITADRTPASMDMRIRSTVPVLRPRRYAVNDAKAPI